MHSHSRPLCRRLTLQGATKAHIHPPFRFRMRQALARQAIDKNSIFDTSTGPTIQRHSDRMPPAQSMRKRRRAEDEMQDAATAVARGL